MPKVNRFSTTSTLGKRKDTTEYTDSSKKPMTRTYLSLKRTPEFAPIPPNIPLETKKAPSPTGMEVVLHRPLVKDEFVPPSQPHTSANIPRSSYVPPSRLRFPYHPFKRSNHPIDQYLEKMNGDPPLLTGGRHFIDEYEFKIENSKKKLEKEAKLPSAEDINKLGRWKTTLDLVKRHQKADENDWREASSESHLAERTVRKELELHADYENPRINSWDKDQKLLRDSNQELWNSFQKNHTPKEGEALGEKRVHKMSSRKRQRTIAKIRKSQETGHSIIRLKLPKIDLNPSLFKSIPR